MLTRPHPLPTLQRLVDSTTGAHALTVLRNDLRAGEIVPEHRHDVEEVLVVVSGRCRVDAGGESAELHAGDAVTVPPHTLHGFRHAGTGPAGVIAVLAAPDALPLPPG